jgi:predicted nucleic acid-binding protein
VGLIKKLQGSLVSIDTSLFIYFIECNPMYIDIVKPVFAGIDRGIIRAITSTVTLLEVLVHPIRTGNNVLAEQYRNILLYSDGIITYGISNEISEIASGLRAKYSIRTPDALQIATGIYYGAAYFLSNDAPLKQISDIEILILDDFRTSG